MDSIWNKFINKPVFDNLKEEIKTDVLIIGGGITGILCGYSLKKAGVDCVVAEADEICSGITENTTAKITYHHSAIYDKMIKRYGIDAAKLYLSAQREALEKYRNLSHEIECDFEETTSYVYSLRDRIKIEKEVTALEKIGCSASFVEDLKLPFSVVGAVRVEKQAQFNPLKFIYSIAKDIKIFEHTKILKIENNCAITAGGRIKAEKIIVATHFPFINTHGGYFLKMYQHRSYVIALENAQKVDGIYIDESEKGLSFRNYKDLLLLGGGGHRTGKSGGNWQELSDFAKRYYPDATEVSRWATQDCKTLDDIPYIGLYSKNTPYIYVATGFNKWGMTNSMVAATVLTNLVQGNKNDYSDIFSPSRSILHPQLAVNTAEALINLLTPTAPRCPHMGCALKYNPAEHSWDCPCHGSRFTENGNLIDNPATEDKHFD